MGISLDLLPIVLGVVSVIVALVFTLLSWHGRTISVSEKTVTVLEKQTEGLKALDKRVEALERGKAAQSIGEETLNSLSNRLAEVEQIVEPLKAKPDFSSAEFNLLLFEVGRIRQDISSWQASFEGRSSHEFSTFRFWFTVGLTIITVLFAIAIYFLTIRGA